MSTIPFTTAPLGGGIGVRLPDSNRVVRLGTPAAASAATDVAAWENEGGDVAGATPWKRPPTRSGKRAEDTMAGCRANAAADLLRAAAEPIAQARARFTHSAAVWTERADLLARLEAKFTARMAGAQM